MPSQRYFVYIFLFLALFSCKKKEDQPINEDFVPLIYEKGQPVDIATSALIGAQGGELSSVDGHVKLMIPAGAVTTPTEISIEPIENTNPGGIGTAFRILPHGLQFKKDIEMVFSYQNELGQFGSAAYLGISYQDDKGYWHYLPSSQINPTAKTVRVKTDHFSDWALMQWMYLLPQESAVKTGEQLDLRAVRVLPIAVESDGLITPLVPPNGTTVMVGPQVDLEQKYIKRWSVSGGGTLSVDKNTAIYTAPNTLPDANPVAVNLELNVGNHQVILVSNVEIMGGDIQFKIGNGALISLDGHLLRKSNGEHVLAGNNNGRLALKWKGNGKYMAYNTNDNVFQYIPIDNKSLYISTYNLLGEPMLISGGGVKIISNKNGIVSGTFTVSPAGHFAAPSGNRLEVAPISGKFRVRVTNL